MILTALRQFRQDHLALGWLQGSAARVPDLVLVDAQYQTDVVHTFCAEGGTAYYPAQGYGTGRSVKAWSEPKAGDGRRIGHQWALVRQTDGLWLAHVHADHWKRQVHAGFAAAETEPGSLTLFAADPRHHYEFAKQVLGEVERVEIIPKKGEVRSWDYRGRNHYLDTCAGARAAAEMLGITLIRPAPSAPVRRRQSAPSKPGGIRTRYR